MKTDRVKVKMEKQPTKTDYYSFLAFLDQFRRVNIIITSKILSK